MSDAQGFREATLTAAEPKLNTRGLPALSPRPALPEQKTKHLGSVLNPVAECARWGSLAWAGRTTRHEEAAAGKACHSPRDGSGEQSHAVCLHPGDSGQVVAWRSPLYMPLPIPRGPP